jgi:hypothetical protein
MFTVSRNGNWQLAMEVTRGKMDAIVLDTPNFHREIRLVAEWILTFAEKNWVLPSEP